MQRPDDDKFISCALDAKALYIVSGDKDLLVMGHYEDVQIITAADFCNQYLKNDSVCKMYAADCRRPENSLLSSLLRNSILFKSYYPQIKETSQLRRLLIFTPAFLASRTR